MFKKIILMFVALFISSNAYAQWDLVNDDSSLHFVSVKKSSVAEVHHFKRLKGSIDKLGNIVVAIDLSSVDTHVAVRNERMKSMLFEIVNFPTAKMTSTVDLQIISAMAKGDSLMKSMTFSLSLHGISQKLVANVRIVKLSKNQLLATSIEPIIVKASNFKLSDGIE
ncbi:MAG: YceI family protein, partial [Mariprofundaceae bacterium]|nr:YceI family protein [Mariprofundaceae bacterium]